MLLKVIHFQQVPCRYFRALFVRKRDAFGNVRAVCPIFDYKNRLENRTELEENVNRRGLADTINIADLYKKWELYQCSARMMKSIEKRQEHLNKMIEKLNTKNATSGKDESRTETYKQEMSNLRSESKCASECYTDIEEEFNISFLTLPNILLPRTPDEPEILFNYGSNSAKPQGQHHLNYEHMIKFINESCYFLQNEAAIFDFKFPLMCSNLFRQHDFTQFSSTDFAKTVVIEAAGTSLENVYGVDEIFHERCTNFTHLVGCGSWMSFLGYIAKTKINKSLLPIQFVSAGKNYQPTVRNASGLFDVAQSTVVQIFLADTEKQINEKFQFAFDLIIQFYKSIDMHFRVVQVPADQLRSAECFAVRIEMYSPNLGTYIEVGNLSNYINFISKRLRFQCEQDETNTQIKPYILSGTVCNVTKLLGIILETYNGTIPIKLQIERLD